MLNNQNLFKNKKDTASKKNGISPLPGAKLKPRRSNSKMPPSNNKDDPDYLTKEQKAIESWQDLGSFLKKRGQFKSHTDLDNFTKDKGSPQSEFNKRSLEKGQGSSEFAKRTSTDSENSHEIVTKKSPTSRAKPSLGPKSNKESLLPPIPKKAPKFNQIIPIAMSDNPPNPNPQNSMTKNLQVPSNPKKAPKKSNPNQDPNSTFPVDTENAPLDPADLKDTGRMLLSPKNENIFAEDSLNVAKSPNLASIQKGSQFDPEQISPS